MKWYILISMKQTKQPTGQKEVLLCKYDYFTVDEWVD